MTHIGFCMGEYNRDTCSDCLCEADCVRMGHDRLVEKIKSDYGLLGGSVTDRVTKLEHSMKRYAGALVELAYAIDKSDPGMQSRTHMRTFWELYSQIGI